MKFPVTTTESHEGKVLEMNAEQEVVTLHSAMGKLLGTLSWGVIIERSTPLAPGTELSVEFSLPDRPWEKHTAKTKVAWTRNKPERNLLFPGMGVKFIEIDEKARIELVELVDALNRSRVSA